MQGEEIHFRYEVKTAKWFGYFPCPDKLVVNCEDCGGAIHQGQRVYINFDNGKRYCESCKLSALTAFVQGGN